MFFLFLYIENECVSPRVVPFKRSSLPPIDDQQSPVSWPEDQEISQNAKRTAKTGKSFANVRLFNRYMYATKNMDEYGNLWAGSRRMGRKVTTQFCIIL